MDVGRQPNRRNESEAGMLLPRDLGNAWRCVSLAIGLLTMGTLGGCTGLRLPSIDPSGNCLFSTNGSTQLSPPCLFGSEGCLSGLSCRSCLGRKGGCSCCLFGLLPEPAFSEPAPPPQCLQGQAPGTPGCPPSCVPGAPYSEDCAAGPPAVIMGKDCHIKDFLHLPKQGRRGRLMLSPNRVVAPVGGEVVLLSGVCGNDGFLATGEPIEWMLTQDSVGHFIEVAPDDANLLQRLANKSEVQKTSGSFARGVTRTKPALITRGTITKRDDVPLEAGQAWVTISSPSEGVSRITALAPESDCWDQRRATTTIYWVDAKWAFPPPQIVRAGSPVVLTTRVTRSEGTIPAVGWKVKYTLLTPELAGFGLNGAPVYEAAVDEAGNATATLNPLPNASGTATIQMEVIRPAGKDADIPALPLGQGTSLVTWSAPKLELRAGGPTNASFDVPITVYANVSNPGDMPTGPVDVTVELPTGVTFVSSDVQHYVSGNMLVWSYENGIPPGVMGDIGLTVSSRNPFQLQFNARDRDNGLTGTSVVRVDVTIPSLDLNVRAAEGLERITAGDSTTFLIEVINTGDRPLTELEIEVQGDQGMSHATERQAKVYSTRSEPLQPGESWKKQLDYVVFESGQRCVTVTAKAAGQAPITREACVIATNPAPVTPAMSASMVGLQSVAIGELNLFRYFVDNTGRVPLTDLQVTATFPAQLEMTQATNGFLADALANYQVKWNLQRVEPGQRVFVEAEFRAIGIPGPSKMYMTARSAEGATSDAAFDFVVTPSNTPPVAPPANLPPVQPSGPAPTIPANPVPLQPPALQGDNNAVPPNPFGQANPPGNGVTPEAGLELTLFDMDDPVLVGAPIRYRISVTNRTNVVDSQVQLSFRLSRDMKILSIQQANFPDAQIQRQQGEWTYLKEISTLRAGEKVDYILVLESDSPQQAGVEVQAYSLRYPNGVASSATTTVSPR